MQQCSRTATHPRHLTPHLLSSIPSPIPRPRPRPRHHLRRASASSATRRARTTCRPPATSSTTVAHRQGVASPHRALLCTRLPAPATAPAPTATAAAAPAEPHLTRCPITKDHAHHARSLICSLLKKSCTPAHANLHTHLYLQTSPLEPTTSARLRMLQYGTSPRPYCRRRASPLLPRLSPCPHLRGQTDQTQDRQHQFAAPRWIRQHRPCRLAPHSGSLAAMRPGPHKTRASPTHQTWLASLQLQARPRRP